MRIHEHFFCVPNRTDMWLTPEPHYTRTVWHLRRHMCLLWNVASVKNPAALQVPGCSCLLLALKSTSETVFYLEMTTISSTSVHLRPYEPQTTPRHRNQEACMFGFVKYWIKGSFAVARPIHQAHCCQSHQRLSTLSSKEEWGSASEVRQNRDERRAFHSWLSRKRQKRDFRSRRNLLQFRPRTPNPSVCLMRMCDQRSRWHLTSVITLAGSMTSIFIIPLLVGWNFTFVS